MPVSPAPVLPGFALRSNELRAIGSSLIVGNTTILPSGLRNRHASKVAAALGAAERNYGVSGSELIADGTSGGWVREHQWVMDNLPSAFPAGFENAGVTLLQHLYNEATTKGTDAAFAATFKNCVRAFASQARAIAAWRVGSSVWTKSGYADQASNASFGGTFSQHNSANNQIIFTSPASFPGGTVCFYFLSRGDASVFRARGKLGNAAFGSGTYVTTLDLTGNAVVGRYTLVVVRVPGVAAGSGQTATVDVDNISVGQVNFMGGTLDSAPGIPSPLCLILSQPVLPTMPFNGFTTALHDAGNQAMRDVAAEFSDGMTRYVDLSPMDAVAAYFRAGDLPHNTEQGNAKITELVLAEAARSPGIPQGFIAGRGRLTAGTPDWSGVPGDEYTDPATAKKWLNTGGSGGLTWVSSAAYT